MKVTVPDELAAPVHIGQSFLASLAALVDAPDAERITLTVGKNEGVTVKVERHLERREVESIIELFSPKCDN